MLFNFVFLCAFFVQLCGYKMKIFLRHIISKTYQPMLKRYLSKTRKYSYEGVKVMVPPTVFHPGFFFSTHFLWQQIENLNLKNKNFLELGCGSGLISILAAKKGAWVTATDISHEAVKTTTANAHANNVSLKITESDLFTNIPSAKFDIIAINPPYYKKNPANAKEQAWYCGENGEYFSKLFGQMRTYTNPETIIYMVLCEGCDIEMIQQAAKTNGWKIACIRTKQKQLEKNYIFSIEQ